MDHTRHASARGSDVYARSIVTQGHSPRVLRGKERLMRVAAPRVRAREVAELLVWLRWCD